MPVPTPHADCSALLAEALHLARLLQQAPHSQNDLSQVRWKDRLRELQRELEHYAHPICRAAIPVEDIPASVRLAFVKAAVLSTRYVESGQGWCGTLHSPTLADYSPDPVPQHWDNLMGLEELCQHFHLEPAANRSIQNLLAAVDVNLKQQRSLIQGILQDNRLHTQSGTRMMPKSDTMMHLFKSLFGAVPLPLAALDCIYTDTQLYFCIAYEGDRLSNKELWETLTFDEQHRLTSFFQSLSQFSFESFRRFPTFGACQPGHISGDWCDRLATVTGMTTSDIRTRISRTTGVMPTAKAEAFLLHDIWGHNWQFMLTSFISDYDILSHCDEPLRARETAYTPDGPLTCGDLFALQGDEVVLDEERAALFFHGEVQQRLGLLFTHLIGELVADVAEFKFIWDYPHAADQLLSSSVFKDKPAKLDLGLGDVDFLFLKVLQPLLSVQLSVLDETCLEHDLLDDWRRVENNSLSLQVKVSLKQAIARLYECFLRDYSATYLPTLGEDTSLFSEMVSNLLYLQNAINALYTDLPKETSLPFQDLLILFIGVFCSHDSYAEFWDVDNAIASYFVPCWNILNQMHDSAK